MATLYTLAYNDHAKDVLHPENPAQLFVDFDYNPRYYNVVSREQTPYLIKFISTYLKVSDYEYCKDGSWHRFSYQHGTEEYAWSNGYCPWNKSAYPNKEAFDEKWNGRLNHVWGCGGDPIPADVFEVFRKMHPNAINGI